MKHLLALARYDSPTDVCQTSCDLPSGRQARKKRVSLPSQRTPSRAVKPRWRMRLFAGTLAAATRNVTRVLQLWPGIHMRLTIHCAAKTRVPVGSRELYKRRVQSKTGRSG